MVKTWPLLGRADDLARVRGLWRKAASSLVVAGDAGVGKTAFARACVELAGSVGCRVEMLLSPLAAGSSSSDGRTLLAALLDELAGCATSTVLLVDDAHLLSVPEAALLYDAAARRGIAVLATMRTGVPTPVPVTALWKNGVATRVDLPPFTEDLVSQVLATVLNGPVEHASAAQLHERCQGSVLYLRELVRGALADGSLAHDHGLWRLTGEPRPSAGLVEIVESELRDLSASRRRALEVIAYAGTLPLATALGITDTDSLDELERSGHLVSRRDGAGTEIALRHPVHCDVLRARVSPARAHAIARRLVELSAAPEAARPDALRLAAWSLDAETTAPTQLLAAANTARWRYDFALAERLVTSAVLAGAGFEGELLAAQLASLQGRNADAERLFVELQRRADTDTRRGQVAVSRLDNIALYQGDIELGLRVAEEAEAAIADPHWRDHVSGVKVGLLIAARGPRAAAHAAEPLLETATGLALVRACGGAGYSFGRTGEIAKALRASDIGYAAHRDLTEPTDWYPWFHLLTRCMALAQAGRFVEADTEARQQHAKGVAETSPEAQAFFAWHLVKVVGERGHITDATHFGREAVALFRELGRPQYAREAQIALVLALALAGRDAEADGLLHEVDDLDLPGDPYTAVELPIARGWAHAARGDLPQAVKTFQTAAELGAEIGDLAGATSALHAAARLGHPEKVLAALTDLAATVEGDLAPARLAHVRALCSRDPDELLEASHAFESMGADLLAAEAAADHADTLLRAGHRRDSTAAQRRARQLSTQCSGATTPALRRLESTATLTRSEYEIALLAAGGASNATIADRLRLSIRTVQNHLQHAYDKLGIHHRGELSFALNGSPVNGASSDGTRSDTQIPAAPI